MTRVVAPLQYESLLEVGVGFGHNLPLLTADRSIKRLAGTDISERAVEHVRQRWPGEFQTMDVQTQKLEAVFELVCCALVLEHVVDDQAALSNLRAMTGRYLLIVTICGDFERYRPWEEGQGHVRNYRVGELEQKLEGLGLTMRRTLYWGFPFYSPISRTLQNHMTAETKFGRGARLAAALLYWVHHLNSSRRGDLLIALAESSR